MRESEVGRVGSANELDREALAQRGKRVEYITIAWNSAEAGMSLVAAVTAGSIALLAFGVDSLIEVASAGALLWRLSQDATLAARERAERLSLRIVGVCFILLAVYIAYEAAVSLLSRRTADRSVLGILVAIASLIVMPLLARAKRRLATGLASRALDADAKQTDLCAYLAVILLGGLALNALFGWWWADPIASALMTPIIALEGYRAIRGEQCCGDGCHSA